jgi:hypothetical protein
MSIIRCPYTAPVNNNFGKTCSKQLCAIWHEPLQMCSHKATAMLLYDIHHVVISLGVEQGFVTLPKEEKHDNSQL